MIYLHLALYSEGKTDDLFLPALIERTAQRIVNFNRGELVEVVPVYLIQSYSKSGSMGGDEQMLLAARMACEHDILIVHKDADTQTHKEALATRFTPGQELIKQVSEKERVCKHIVPVVPVRMIEAWLLADWQTVLEKIGADTSPNALKALRGQLKKLGLALPNKPHQAASDHDPKHTLDQVVKIMRERKQTTINDLYELMGDSIRLQTLERMDDYKRFVDDLTAALVSLGKIQL